MQDLRARNRSKYRARGSLTPQQQCEVAVRLIKSLPELVSSPELVAKCKAEVTACVASIQEWKVKEERWLKGQKQAPLRNYKDKLRAAEIAGAKLAGTFFGDNEFVLKTIKNEREFIEGCLEGFKPPRRHGGTHKSPSMASAATHAWRILRLYGYEPPLTERALWHQLSAALFGTEVDSFSFDYLKHVWSRLHPKKEIRPV